MPEETTIDENPQVLPAEGKQPLYDFAYQLGQGFKSHAVWFTGGMAVGALLALYLIQIANRR